MAALERSMSAEPFQVVTKHTIVAEEADDGVIR